jgi:excisionase family DNA binding protein
MAKPRSCATVLRVTKRPERATDRAADLLYRNKIHSQLKSRRRRKTRGNVVTYKGATSIQVDGSFAPAPGGRQTQSMAEVRGAAAERLAVKSRDELRVTEPQLMRVDEVARFLAISKRTVWRLVGLGQLAKPLSIGRCKRWRRDDIEAFLTSLN